MTQEYEISDEVYIAIMKSSVDLVNGKHFDDPGDVIGIMLRLLKSHAPKNQLKVALPPGEQK